MLRPKLAVLDADFPSLAAYDRFLASGRSNVTDEVPHGAAVARVVANALDRTLLADLEPTPITISYAHDQLADSFADALSNSPDIDVLTNSWGVGRAFADDFDDRLYQPAGAALETAVAAGRDGLGKIVVFAAGNARQQGDNVNHHNFQNAPETITVGALDADGHAAAYSTPGAAVLLSAVGTDVALSPPSQPGADDAITVTGTSFAAPQVSAAVARMLEANPTLSYRDVQEILARSATPVEARQTPADAPDDGLSDAAAADAAAVTPSADDTTPSWLGATNAATDWNGGGLLFDPRVGFGALNADAAVRMAKAWSGLGNHSDRRVVEAAVEPGAAIPDGAAPLVVPLQIGSGVEIEQVSLDIDLSHSWIGDLTVTLVSPNGTRSVLLDRPGKAPDSRGFGSSADDIDFTLTSNAFRGESAEGQWQLEVADAGAGFAGTLNAATLEVAGRTVDQDDTYVYTDAFGDLAAADAARATLNDTGGHDHFLAAALSQDATIDLTPGATSLIAGRALQLRASTAIEDASGGAGRDIMTGNALDNILDGGPGADVIRGEAGADVIRGGAGADTLTGGAGNDSLTGGGGADRFVWSGGADRIDDFDPAAGDRISQGDQADGPQSGASAPGGVAVTATDDGVMLSMDDGSSVQITGIDTFDADWFIA